MYTCIDISANKAFRKGGVDSGKAKSHLLNTVALLEIELELELEVEVEVEVGVRFRG